MLGVTRYRPGRYPPSSQFPKFSDAGPAPAEYKRLQDRQASGMLEKMQERKKGSLEILKQRAAPYQAAQAPTAMVPRPAALEQFDITTLSDFDSANDGRVSGQMTENPTETEGERLDTVPEGRVRRLASAAVRTARSAASSATSMVLGI